MKQASFTLMKYLIFILFLLVIMPAQAQSQAENDTLRTGNLREVNVYSLKNNPDISILSLPVTSLSKRNFETPALFTPADVLQRRAGISLSRDGIWATSVNIRGLSKERLLILADDERIQTATDLAAALSTIDMYSLERIEIIKGAGSVLYGTGAMGGVVNFITERPEYASGRKVNGRIGSGFNLVNNLWTNHARVQLTDHNWYIGANGSYRTAQDMKTPKGKLNNSQFNDASFGVQAGMIYDETQEFLLNYQHFEAWNVGMPGGTTFRDDAIVRYRNITRNQLSGEYVLYEPTRRLNELRIKAYTQNISRDVENYIQPQLLTILPSSTNVTSGGKILTDWDLGSRHVLKGGVEGWFRDTQTKRYRIKDDVNVEKKYTVTGEQPVPDASMLDLGIFAQYSWKIYPSKLKLDAGLRLDYIHIKNDSAYEPVFQYVMEDGKRTDINLPNRGVLFTPGKSNEFSYAAHLDIIYQPRFNHSVIFSVSNAYRAASLEERFKYIDQQGLLSVGNPNLKPEQGIFANLSYAYTSSRFKFSGNLFASYLFDLISAQRQSYQKPDGTTEEALVNTNIDKALFIGAELEAAYWFISNFWFNANISYTRARDLKNKEFLPEIPPMKGLAELNYCYHNVFTTSLSTQWAAKQSEVTNEESTDGYAILNLVIKTEKLKMRSVYWQFFAGMDNILDTEYYNHLSSNRGIIKAEPGRNIYVKALFGW